MRTRAVLVLVALALGGLGAAVAYRALRPHAPTVVGSTTTEFTYTAITRPTPRREAEAPWPTYGHDDARSRAVAGGSLLPPFRKVWMFRGHALLEFPPVVAGGRLYITTFRGILWALDARTGRTDWVYRSGRCGWASPAVDGGRVFETFIGNPECHSRHHDGEVVAFDARTGKRLWLRTVGPTETSPLARHGTVYVGDAEGRLWALRESNGRTRWYRQLDGPIKSSVAGVGRRLYVATYGGTVLCLGARTGRVLWTSGGHGRFYSSPSVAYGRVYIGSLDGGVYAFGATTGHLLWSHPTGSYVYASPAIGNGLVLVGSYDHRFYALDAGTGATRWSFPADGAISGAASVIDGLVWFSTFAHSTYALGVDSGRQRLRWADGEYSPAVAGDGLLYWVGLGDMWALRPERASP